MRACSSKKKRTNIPNSAFDTIHLVKRISFESPTINLHTNKQTQSKRRQRQNEDKKNRRNSIIFFLFLHIYWPLLWFCITKANSETSLSTFGLQLFKPKRFFLLDLCVQCAVEYKTLLNQFCADYDTINTN